MVLFLSAFFKNCIMKSFNCLILLILFSATVKANTIEIRYFRPEAKQVSMIWGINDWTPIDEKPAGTVLNDGVMRTPMVRQGNYFVLNISVPDKCVVDYAFTFNAVKGPFKLHEEYWDLNNHPEKKFYHTNSIRNCSITIVPDLRYVKPAREIAFIYYAEFWFIFFLLLALLAYLFKEKSFKKKHTTLNNTAVLLGSVALTVLVFLIIIRCVTTHLAVSILVTPLHSLPIMLKTSYYDFLYVLVLSLLFGILLFTFKKKQKLVLGLFIITAFLSIIASLLNIKIIEALGRPFTYQWLYYSDFLKSTDSKQAMSANIDSKYIIGVLLILLSTMSAAFSIYWMTTAKTIKIISIVVIGCLGLGYFSSDDPSIPYAQRANPVAFFAASINPLTGGSLFSKENNFKSEFLEKNKNVVQAEYDSLFNKSKIKNVIILVLESTPAEYITSYNNKIKATPFLDSIKQNAALFDAIYSHAPATNKSMFSILCGNYPYLSFKTITAEKPDIKLPSITSELEKYGYRTSFFNSGDNRFQGADNFLKYRQFTDISDFSNNTCGVSFSARQKDSSKNLSGTDDGCLSINCLNWIDQQPKEPFFSMLWTFQTHYPYYSGSSETNFGVKDVMLNKYLNALHHADETLKHLVEGLKSRNLFESTLIVVLGDHGEAFGRHGQTTHALALYEENLHIPLIFINPLLFHGEHLISTGGISDVAPSIFSVLNKPAPNEWQGENLFGVNRRKRVYFFTPWSDYLFGYREGDYKYIYNATNNSSELYNLKNDPAETNNIADKYPAYVKDAKNNIMSWMQYQNNYMKPLVSK